MLCERLDGRTRILLKKQGVYDILVYDYIIPGEIYSMNDKCVVLNAKKMNFDGKLDFSVLSSDVTVYDDTGMRKS